MTDSAFDLDAVLAEALYTGPTVSADRLVGVDACLRQLAGQLALLRRPELGERFGITPSGTLFLGPPGTGKTLLARYLAGELEMPMYQVSADIFGAQPGHVHALFRALGGRRALLFIDEVSIIAQRRDWSVPEDRRMLTALLTELDGLGSAPGPERLWVIGAATPDIRLDAAGDGAALRAIDHVRRIGTFIADMHWWVVRTAPDERFVLGDTPLAVSVALGHVDVFRPLVGPDSSSLPCRSIRRSGWWPRRSRDFPWAERAEGSSQPSTAPVGGGRKSKSLPRRWSICSWYVDSFLRRCGRASYRYPSMKPPFASKPPWT